MEYPDLRRWFAFGMNIEPSGYLREVLLESVLKYDFFDGDF